MINFSPLQSAIRALDHARRHRDWPGNDRDRWTRFVKDAERELVDELHRFIAATEKNRDRRIDIAAAEYAAGDMCAVEFESLSESIHDLTGRAIEAASAIASRAFDGHEWPEGWTHAETECAQ